MPINLHSITGKFNSQIFAGRFARFLAASHALSLAIVLFFTLAFTQQTLAELSPKADPAAVFPVEMVTLKTAAGEFRFTVEIADDDDERSQGLMFRETMLPTHGMLFDFKRTANVFMWMENTPLSLDMIFIRPDGTIARIEQRTTPFSRDIISSGEPVSHVLELNAGISKQIGLKTGDLVLHETFAKN